MSDHQSDLAFQDVEEELRKERLTTLWRKFGKYIIAVCILVVVGIGAREAWRSYVASQAEHNAGIYGAAEKTVEGLGVGQEAAEAWAAAAEDLSSGYAAMAQLQSAAAFQQSGNFSDAIKEWDALAARTDVPQVYRDLASLMAAMTMLDQVGDADAALSRLSVVAKEGNPWYGSAKEQMGLASMMKGDYAAAKGHFDALLFAEGVPATIAARARDLSALSASKLKDQAAAARGELSADVPAPESEAASTGAPQVGATQDTTSESSDAAPEGDGQ